MKKYLQYPLCLSLTLLLTAATVNAADPPIQTITIYVDTIPKNGAERYSISDLAAISTVTDLRGWLYDNKGMHPSTQGIIFGGKVLGGHNRESDNQRLAKYGIKNGSTIKIVRRKGYAITLDMGEGEEKVGPKEFNDVQKIEYIKEAFGLSDDQKLFYKDKELLNEKKMSDMQSDWGVDTKDYDTLAELTFSLQKSVPGSKNGGTLKNLLQKHGGKIALAVLAVVAVGSVTAYMIGRPKPKRRATFNG